MSAKKRKGTNRPRVQQSGKATKKERRDQIRQARIEAQRRRIRARRRKVFMTWGLVGLVVVAGVVFAIFRSIESGRVLKTDLEEAGCSDVEEFAAQAPTHIDTQPAPERVPYNSDPPTSGQHFGSQVGPWGSHRETLPPEIFVHNLEHGGVVIHYKDLPETDVVALEELADSYADGVVVMPNDSIDKPLVMSAWGLMQTCEKYSETVVKDFISDRCGKQGPEARLSTCGPV